MCNLNLDISRYVTSWQDMKLTNHLVRSKKCSYWLCCVRRSVFSDIISRHFFLVQGSDFSLQGGMISVADLEFWKEGFQYVINECVWHLLGGSGGMLPQENYGFLTWWDRFWCLLVVKLQKLDNLLLNLFGVFEARRFKGVTPLRVAEAAKQLIIHVRQGVPWNPWNPLWIRHWILMQISDI